MSLPDGRYFKAVEFRCRDAARTPYPEHWLDRWLLIRDLCDAVRDLWGAPLRVVSGYRTPEHNMDLMAADEGKGSHGVVSSSQHIIGNAADLAPASPNDVPQLTRVILAAHETGKLPALGGLGDYPQSGWCHVDTYKPADGHLRRWRGR